MLAGKRMLPSSLLRILKNQRQITHSPVQRFPRKLWKLASECQTGAISWSPDGTSILVRYSLFKEEFMNGSDDLFKTDNISSFIRQLNLYGFRKVYRNAQKAAYKSNPDLHEFSNPFFQRGRPDLLLKVSRRTKDASKVLTAVSPPGNLKIKLVIKAPSNGTSGQDSTAGTENSYHSERCLQESAVPSSANALFQQKKFSLLDNVIFKNLQSLGTDPVHASTSAPGASVHPVKVQKKRGRKPGVKIGSYKVNKAKRVETPIMKVQDSAVKNPQNPRPSLVQLDDGDPPQSSIMQDQTPSTDESSSTTLFNDDDESLFPPNYSLGGMLLPVFTMPFQETLKSVALNEIMEWLYDLEDDSDSD